MTSTQRVIPAQACRLNRGLPVFFTRLVLVRAANADVRNRCKNSSGSVESNGFFADTIRQMNQDTKVARMWHVSRLKKKKKKRWQNHYRCAFSLGWGTRMSLETEQVWRLQIDEWNYYAIRIKNTYLTWYHEKKWHLISKMIPVIRRILICYFFYNLPPFLCKWTHNFLYNSLNQHSVMHTVSIFMNVSTYLCPAALTHSHSEYFYEFCNFFDFRVWSKDILWKTFQWIII